MTRPPRTSFPRSAWERAVTRRSRVAGRHLPGDEGSDPRCGAVGSAAESGYRPDRDAGASRGRAFPRGAWERESVWLVILGFRFFVLRSLRARREPRPPGSDNALLDQEGGGFA